MISDYCLALNFNMTITNHTMKPNMRITNHHFIINRQVNTQLFTLITFFLRWTKHLIHVSTVLTIVLGANMISLNNMNYSDIPSIN